jgi:hypothetical protein
MCTLKDSVIQVYAALLYAAYAIYAVTTLHRGIQALQYHNLQFVT